MRVRSLPELRAAGYLPWFEAALSRRSSLSTEPDARLTGFLDPGSPTWISRAPGRLDVMGGIADYSGATVLELPLDRATWVLLQRQAAPRIDLATRRDGQWQLFGIDQRPLLAGELRTPQALAKWFAEHDADRWAAYVVGGVQLLLRRGGTRVEDVMPGFRLLIDSSVPEGSGVASSAALEVAAMAAVAASVGDTMAPPELAAACHWVENHIVGAPCGIMDQMTSACGRTDRLLRLRCQPAIIDGQVAVPKGYRFYGIGSGIRHAVSGADYGTVRTAAFMGYRMIAGLAGLPAVPDGERVRIEDHAWHGCLANIPAGEFSGRYEFRLPEEMTGEEFLAGYAGITDTVTRVEPGRRYPVRAATAHPVREQARVTQFVELLTALATRPDAAAALGGLLAESHKSYGSCGLGSDGTDRLVELVAATGPARGLYGARITGGGSGGTVAILGRDDAEAAVQEIAAGYAAETGRKVEVFTASGPGAAETGVVLIESALPTSASPPTGTPHQ
jgi:L-arabinokinase